MIVVPILLIIIGFVLVPVLAFMSDASLFVKSLISIAFVFIGFFLIIRDQNKTYEKELTEQRARKAELKKWMRCPYCGEDYSDRMRYSSDSNELHNCARTCKRHFYFSESQIPRTPEHRALLKAEARDAARISSPEFEDKIRSVYLHFKQTRHREGFITMENDHAYNYTSYQDLTKDRFVYYAPFETDAGRTLLAMACMNYIREHHNLTYCTFQLMDHGFSWKYNFD